MIIKNKTVYLETGFRDELMKVEMPIIPWDECSEIINDGFNLTNQICAGLGGKDACKVR